MDSVDFLRVWHQHPYRQAWQWRHEYGLRRPHRRSPHLQPRTDGLRDCRAGHRPEPAGHRYRCHHGQRGQRRAGWCRQDFKHRRRHGLYFCTRRLRFQRCGRQQPAACLGRYPPDRGIVEIQRLYLCCGQLDRGDGHRSWLVHLYAGGQRVRYILCELHVPGDR